tara:strand:+ start:127 stop:660 length:534 start_codon:yes stop_codon:yes gene_type:complete
MANVIEDQQNEKSMFRTLLNKVPANIRFFASDLLGMDSSASNENFSDKGIAVLKEAAINALDQGKSSMSYEDYPGGEMNFNENFLSKLQDPNFNMRTTIGSANLRINENGDIILTDQFNFNDAKDIKSLSDAKNAVLDIFGEEGLYKKIRKIGTYAGSEEGEGSSIELNLGQYNPKV